ncbi:MAG: ribonuclease R family protein, partial [Anaeroplasmataceae bacterium]
TSVYLADRVIPMLPHVLSNGICSLNEGVNRLVLSCLMEIDPKGNLVNYQIKEGIIKSTHRMTYKKINKMLDNDKELIEEYSDIYPMVLNMLELSKILRDKRTKVGAIDFETCEFKVSLDELGNPIEFVLRERGLGELLIEDFMLTANETVAYHMSVMNLLCCYRVHETPDEAKVLGVFEFIKNMGYDIKVDKKLYPKSIQNALSAVKNKNESYIINQMLLRSMMKAKYSEVNLGHYGLAFKYYCHFTSPIRRYPDLMTHRLIKSLYIHTENFEHDFTTYKAILHDVCLKSSLQERRSIECERDVNDMLMASFMLDKIGSKFSGVISSITNFGMFVTLENGIEGLIHVSNMKQRFTFNEINLTMNSKTEKYSIGDKVDIVVYGASKFDRKVDFMLEKDYNNFIGDDQFESNIRK